MTTPIFKGFMIGLSLIALPFVMKFGVYVATLAEMPVTEDTNFVGLTAVFITLGYTAFVIGLLNQLFDTCTCKTAAKKKKKEWTHDAW